MLSKKKLVSLSVGAVLAAAFVLTQTAASSQGQRRYKLEGSWIGHRVDPNHVDKFRWSGLLSPSDPAGKTAALRLSATEWSPGYDQLVAMHGGNTASAANGSVKMVSNNQAQWTMIAYEQTTFPVKIVAIEVYSGTWTFTGPDSAVIEYSVKVYPASSDTDADGLPDTGSPDYAADGIVDNAQRVPILR